MDGGKQRIGREGDRRVAGEFGIGGAPAGVEG
jgi:hypothetical protein